MSRLRIGLLAALALAAGGAAIWGSLTLVPRQPSSQPSLAASVTTAIVTRQTISNQQQETGTIGYSASYSVVNQYTPPPSAADLAQLQDAVKAAQQALSDQEAQNAFTEQQDANAVAADTAQLQADQAQLTRDQQAHDAQAVNSDQQKVNQDQAKLAQNQAKQQSDQLTDTRQLHQAQATLRSDQDQLNLKLQPGGGGGGSGGGGGGTPAIYTSLPAVGQTVSRGQTLYSINQRPIPLLYGSTPIGRQLTAGVSGPYVQELEANLVALGYGSGLATDGNFTQADAAAVKRWQAALGAPQTGVVNPGDAVILPAPLLVSQVKVAAGASAQAGAEIIDGTSTTPVVTIALDARDQTLARVGEPVDVQLPSGQDVRGTITAVGTVATTSGQGSSQTTTIPVTVTLADNGAAGKLDGASVTVNLNSETHTNVLTVPIAALVAVPGGGYAVETAAHTHRRIPVQTGIFSSSQVEVSGQGLYEGLKVESPSL
jgi:multidrug efflux pump subunit AcrA (membrane-fusion protein)